MPEVAVVLAGPEAGLVLAPEALLAPGRALPLDQASSVLPIQVGPLVPRAVRQSDRPRVRTPAIRRT